MIFISKKENILFGKWLIQQKTLKMRFIRIKKKIRKILNSKELIFNLVLKEIKLKYKNSMLGFLWTLIDPLFMIAIFLLIFTKLFRYELPSYPSYLLIGIFVWNYFSDATMKGLYSLSSYARILTKTPVSKSIIILSLNLFNMIDFLLKFIILIFVLVLLKMFYTWPSLINLNFTILYIPIIIILQFMLILGLSKILSLCYIHLKDVQNIWGILLHAGFFLTPIFYPPSIIPAKYKFLLLLNPLNHLIELYRDIIIKGTAPNMLSFSLVFFFSFSIMLIGAKLFKKFQHTISQEV